MIKSFKNSATAQIFNGAISPKLPPAIQARALVRLTALHIAENLFDLRNPPGNRLEALKGDRQGQFSLRINDQYRICFRWLDNNAEEVEIVDYHR